MLIDFEIFELEDIFDILESDELLHEKIEEAK